MVKGSGDAGTGLAVRPKIHKTDFAQRRFADDVDRAGELPTIDRDLLVRFNELELIDGGANRRLPGKTVRAEETISLAADVSRETIPEARSFPSSTRMPSLWPTPLAMSWPKRIGRFCDGMPRPARSTITGYRQPAIRIAPPV